MLFEVLIKESLILWNSMQIPIQVSLINNRQQVFIKLQKVPGSKYTAPNHHLKRENGKLYLENTCSSCYLKQESLQWTMLPLLSVKCQSCSQLKNKIKIKAKATGSIEGNVLSILSFSINLINDACFSDL